MSCHAHKCRQVAYVKRLLCLFPLQTDCYNVGNNSQAPQGCPNNFNTIPTAHTILHNFCGIYHDRNHHQLWRLGSRDVTMLETIHKHHRAVQTISTLMVLHIRSFTNNFCGIYHDRNHHQTWRLGSRDVTKLETIHKHHRAVQTISTPILLHTILHKQFLWYLS